MSEYDDSHMLSKVLERMAAQALHLKDKIDSGLEIPSWAEYKVYNAYSGLGSALGTAYPGEYEEKMAADWSQYDVDDVHAAGRIAENHITDDPSELSKKIHAGLLKDPTHPKHAPSMVPLGVVGGGALGAGLGYPLSFIPKMRYAPAVTGAAGALLGGLTGHKVTKDLRGAGGDRIHQEALATQKRRLASSALMSQLSRDVAEDYLRSIDELMDKESSATFSKSLDKHPALKGKQSQLPDEVQAGIIKKKLRMRKQAAASTLGEGLFLMAKRPALAKAYNDLRSARVQKLLQTEIPGTKGIHLPGLNPQRVESLSSQLAHPETAVQIALPLSYVHMPIAESIKKRMPGLKDLIKESAAATFSQAMDKHPALKGKQSQLPDKVQAGIIKKKLRMRKQAASTESQVLKALSVEGGAAGMGALKKRVKEDDLQSAIKSLIASGKVRKHPDGDLIKESASPRFSSDGDRLYHDLGGGVSFSLPEGAEAERYKKQVEKDHGYVGSTAPTSKDDHYSVRAGKALSRRLDKKNPNRPRYRSLKDFILRRPDPNYRPGAEVRPLKKQAAATATKTDPAKWEAAKREAKNKMGGKHSARAMQLATQIYKKNGGGYSGSKPTSKNNSLKKWTKQKWNWSGGDKPGPGGKGVYLPKKKAEGLKKSESGRKRLAAASRKKSEATHKGEQYSSHGLAKGTSLRAKK